MKIKKMMISAGKVAGRRHGAGGVFKLRIEPILTLLSVLFFAQCAEALVLQSMIEDQRREYIGSTGEVVVVWDNPVAPLAVSDGSTTGMVQVLGIAGGLRWINPLSITNDSEWVGWATTGSLTPSNTLRLAASEWVESPLLTGGAIELDLSGIHSAQSGTSWTSILYTNTPSTPVEAPYTGDNSHLRITAGGSVALGASDIALFVDYLKIKSSSDATALVAGRSSSQFKIIAEPVEPEQIARLSTVTNYHAQATGYTDAEIIKYSRDSGKVLRGSMVFYGAGWNFLPNESNTNATGQIGWGGFPMMEFDLDVAGCTIDTFVATNGGTTATFGVATNGVDTLPVIEYTSDLTTADWIPTSWVSSSYPALVDGKYEIVIDKPDGDNAYFRCLRKIDAAISAFADITTPAGNSIDGSVQASSTGDVSVVSTAGIFTIGSKGKVCTFNAGFFTFPQFCWVDINDSELNNPRDPVSGYGVGDRDYNDARHPMRSDGITTNLNGFVIVDGVITGTY